MELQARSVHAVFEVVKADPAEACRPEDVRAHEALATARKLLRTHDPLSVSTEDFLLYMRSRQVEEALAAFESARANLQRQVRWLERRTERLSGSVLPEFSVEPELLTVNA